MTSAAVNPESSQPAGPPCVGANVIFARVEPQQRRCALAMLLTGGGWAHDPAVDPFLAFADDHELCLDELWVAHRCGDPLAAMLIVPSPGRTAMAFLSPVPERLEDATAVNLVRTVCQAQDAAKVRIIQALLDPGQRNTSNVLSQAGFHDLAKLVYMQRTAQATPTPLEFEDSIQCVHWSNQQRAHFANAIAASYQGTLDCPGLLGLRHIDDIIAGHRGTGQFRPELWFALHRHGEPVGVMLLNLIAHAGSMELVYLGVSPSWRGRGIGRRLLAHGLAVATEYAVRTVILAVDRSNKPALRMYRSMKFTSTAQKLAMIYVPGSG